MRVRGVSPEVGASLRRGFAHLDRALVGTADERPAVSDALVALRHSLDVAQQSQRPGDHEMLAGLAAAVSVLFALEASFAAGGGAPNVPPAQLVPAPVNAPLAEPPQIQVRLPVPALPAQVERQKLSLDVKARVALPRAKAPRRQGPATLVPPTLVPRARLSPVVRGEAKPAPSKAADTSRGRGTLVDHAAALGPPRLRRPLLVRHLRTLTDLQLRRASLLSSRRMTFADLERIDEKIADHLAALRWALADADVMAVLDGLQEDVAHEAGHLGPVLARADFGGPAATDAVLDELAATSDFLVRDGLWGVVALSASSSAAVEARLRTRFTQTKDAGLLPLLAARGVLSADDLWSVLDGEVPAAAAAAADALAWVAERSEAALMLGRAERATDARSPCALRTAVILGSQPALVAARRRLDEGDPDESGRLAECLLFAGDKSDVPRLRARANEAAADWLSEPATVAQALTKLGAGDVSLHQRGDLALELCARARVQPPCMYHPLSPARAQGKAVAAFRERLAPALTLALHPWAN